ncbi:CsbD family protein [Nocardia tengchongensis]|uniref:CsbD family protein n=1 Tax=Nocardia tengchongensis TaxID=2055889 RepID=UPI0036C929D6
MSATDKARNKADEMAGLAKEKFGEATDNPDKKNEGKAEQVMANLKDAAEKVKDAFHK